MALTFGGQVERTRAREERSSDDERASGIAPLLNRSPERIFVVGASIEHLAAELLCATFDVELVPCFEDAVARFGADVPSCVLVAVGSDATLCRTIRVGLPGPAAVVAVVSDDDSALPIACLSAGADDVVSSAMPSALLVARVSAHLRRSRAELERARERDRKLAGELTMAEARAVEARAELAKKDTGLTTISSDLDALGYAVAHDLRAPLRAIEGFSRALEEDQGHLLEEPGRRHLARVQAASARMAALIDDVNVLSRMMRAPLARERTDLSELARIVARSIIKRDPDREGTIDVEDNLVAECDSNLVRTVLEKLIGNAWKFTSRRKRAEIIVGRTAVADHGRAFFVRDNGVGFDMTLVDKLFRPFSRLHLASEFEGRGSGLATVRWIIGRHGGRVWANSSPDGASFFFTL